MIQVHFFQIVGRLDDERKNIVFAGDHDYVVDQIIQHAKGTHGMDLSRGHVANRIAGKKKKVKVVLQKTEEKVEEPKTPIATHSINKVGNKRKKKK